MTLPTLRTKRLVLRPFLPSDAPEIQRMAGIFEVAEMTTAMPHPYPDGAAEEWMALHEPQWEARTTLSLAITHEGTLLGAMSLLSISAGHQAELGYWIGKEHWRKGFATEAAQAMLDYAFTSLGLVRVHAQHLKRNPASGRVLQKIGMKHEGRRIGHARRWDITDDLELYGIVKNA